MNVELTIWVACILSLPYDLPNGSDWIEIENSWKYETQTWSVKIEPFLDIEVPSSISQKDINVKHQYVVSLTPFSLLDNDPGQEGSLYLQKVLRKIISTCTVGVLETPHGPVRFDEYMNTID